MADERGLDNVLAGLEALQAELGDRFAPAPLLREKVAAGDLGRKTGRGHFSQHRYQGYRARCCRRGNGNGSWCGLLAGCACPAGTGMPIYRKLRLEAEKQAQAEVVEDEGAKTA